MRTQSATDTKRDDKPSLDPWRLLSSRKRLYLSCLGILIINRACGLVLPYLSKPFVQEVLVKHKPTLLLPIVLAVIVATAVQALTSFLNSELLSKEAIDVVTGLRKQMQQHLIRQRLSFYDMSKTGALTSQVMNDVDGVRNLFGAGIVEMVGAILTAGFAFLYLVIRNAEVTAAVFIIILIYLLLLRRSFKVIRPILGERARLTNEVSGRLHESFSGIRVIKAYNAERLEDAAFAHGIASVRDSLVASLRALNLMSMLSASSLGLVGALVMLLCGSLALKDKMVAGDYVQYTLFLAFLIAPLMQLLNNGTQVSEALAGLARAQVVLRRRKESDDPTRTRTLDHIEGEVRFESVRFSYHGTERPVLQDLSFLARRGTVTALVGSSGAGKSTITNLICGFYKPDTGTVFVDEIDLSSIELGAYRARLGVVLQESFLFDDTLRNNIMFSRPSATQEEYQRACRLAYLTEMIEKLPHADDTVVGERGLKLSGGQRQRVSIARAILADPTILILDEATSSLDTESEALIQQGLEHLKRGRTTFVIAHRLATIQSADQILVIEGGQIIEQGSHAALYSMRGRYYELHARQFREDAE